MYFDWVSNIHHSIPLAWRLDEYVRFVYSIASQNLSSNFNISTMVVDDNKTNFTVSIKAVAKGNKTNSMTNVNKVADDNKTNSIADEMRPNLCVRTASV